MLRFTVPITVGLLLLLQPTGSTAGRCLLELDRPEDLLAGPALELKSLPASLAKAPTPIERADRAMDVLHYDVSLEVSLESEFLSGTVESRLVVLAPTDTLVFDLLGESDPDDLNEPEADSLGITVLEPLRIGGVPHSFDHLEDEIRIPLLQTAAVGDTLRTEISFEGRPVRDYIVGYALRYFFDRTDPELPILPDEPVVMTLSEPDAARSWWPCHDHPYDAATMELSLIAPARFTLAAPGLLTGDEDLGGGLRRQTWSMPSPIPTYLLSINLADYEVWEEQVTVDHLVDPDLGVVEERTMPIQYFVPDFEEAAARHTWANTAPMIDAFAERFGPYPFADLKYGMSLFTFGGAMEHPTVSSMGQFTISTVDNDFGAPAGEWVSAHELAHQWFGDAVRVERWGEIWLNEGFAQWAESFWFEIYYGEAAGKEWMDGIWRESYPGSLVNPGQLFGNTVYKKGARVVHQLRQVLGDEAFFTALRNYLTDPELRFGRAVSSDDLQAHCEATYGESLDWFFEPWLHWEGRPSLRVTRHRTDSGARLIVRQPEDRTYRLPLPIRVFWADGSTEDRVVWIGEDGPQTEVDFETEVAITDIRIDPERDWLLDVEVEASLLTQRAKLVRTYPNPFNPEVNIEYFAGESLRARLDVYDLRGRHVRRLLDEDVGPGVRTATWVGLDDDGSPVASGTYLVVLRTDVGVEERRTITLLK